MAVGPNGAAPICRDGGGPEPPEGFVLLATWEFHCVGAGRVELRNLTAQTGGKKKRKKKEKESRPPRIHGKTRASSGGGRAFKGPSVVK